jgi:hypothetical protein
VLWDRAPASAKVDRVSAHAGTRPTELPSSPLLRAGRLAAGLVLGATVVAALVLARADALLLLLPHLRGWDAVAADALIENVHGLWRVMRGGIRFLVAPAVIVVVGICLVDLLRHGRPRSAGVALGVALGSFGTVELLKAGVVPGQAWIDAGAQPHVMSGHVAAASAALVPLLVAARRVRGLVAVLGALLVAGVAVGVVLARWHTVADGLGSMAVAAPWAVAAACVVRAATGSRANGSDPLHSLRNRLAVVGALLTAGAAVVLALVVPTTAARATGMVAAAVLLVGAASLTAAAAAWLGAALVAHEPGSTIEKGRR